MASDRAWNLASKVAEISGLPVDVHALADAIDAERVAAGLPKGIPKWRRKVGRVGPRQAVVNPLLTPTPEPDKFPPL